MARWLLLAILFAVSATAQPRVSIRDSSGPEGFAMTFVVDFATGAEPVTVDYATADGTAIAGVDYTSRTGTLTFPANSSGIREINVFTTPDSEVEATETFFVNLSNANAQILDGQAVGAITDSEARPSISVGDYTLTEGDSGPTAFLFEVTLSHGYSQTITANYQTVDGTADASDYITTGGLLTFGPFVTSQTVRVDVIGDVAFEPDEEFFLRLTTVTSATVADGEGTGTIVNDDQAVADLAIVKSGPATAVVGMPVTFTITVTNAGPQAATGVQVTDPIPAGTTFVSATPSQGSCSGTTFVTCALGTIAAGANATIELVVNAPTTPGSISNTATVVTTNDFDPVLANDASTAIVAVGQATIPTASTWALLLFAFAIAALATIRLRG